MPGTYSELRVAHLDADAFGTMWLSRCPEARLNSGRDPLVYGSLQTAEVAFWRFARTTGFPSPQPRKLGK